MDKIVAKLDTIIDLLRKKKHVKKQPPVEQKPIGKEALSFTILF